MPLYEYGCPSCGQVTDVRHGFDEKPQITCERCGAVLVRRFSAAPIVFKGSGFYVTDSRSKSNGKSEKSESGEKSEKTETKTETKTESKSESKTEPKTDSPKDSGAGKKTEAAA